MAPTKSRSKSLTLFFLAVLAWAAIAYFYDAPTQSWSLEQKHQPTNQTSTQLPDNSTALSQPEAAIPPEISDPTTRPFSPDPDLPVAVPESPPAQSQNKTEPNDAGQLESTLKRYRADLQTLSQSSTPLLPNLAAPATQAQFELLESLSQTQVQALNRRFYSATAPAAAYAVDRYRITFQTRHDGGTIYPAQADVYVPRTTAPTPVIGVGAGTTGIFDQCAPSRENIDRANWGDYHGNHAAWAGQGYTLVFPDYSGFNDTDTLHHYFVAELEGRVILDSLQATYQLQDRLKVELEEQIILTGYSQGAHAALAAADLWPDYRPELPLRGVIGYGAANNTIDLLRNNAYLGPYLIYAYNDLYGDEVINPAAALQGWAADSLEQDLQACVDGVLNLYGRDIDRVYQPALTQALRQGTMAQTFAPFNEKLEANTTGYGDWQLPVLVVQGVNDPITPVATQQKMMRRLCQTGKTVTYLELASASHYDIRQKTLPQSLQWIKSVFNDQSVPNYCQTL